MSGENSANDLARRRQEWVVAIVAITAVLTVSAGLVWAGSDQGRLVGSSGWSVFGLCALVSFAVQWVMFAQAWLARSEGYFDLVGSLTYICVAWVAVLVSGANDLGAWIIVALITTWALRLGPFLFLRIRAAGEDKRFKSIRNSFPTFLMTWTLQGAWVFITAGCALAAISGYADIPLGPSFVIGFVLWLIGFGLEVVADRQKTVFRSNPANADDFIKSGLWAWSRHPNYFGEIVLWFGIALMAWPALQGWQLVTLISPIWVVILLYFISGVRMLENRADRKWGGDPDYEAYKKATPVLVPKPPRG